LGAVSFLALLPLVGRAGLLSQADASLGVKTALEKGATAALGSLGASDGFLGNPKVKIQLPQALEQAAKVLKFSGQQKKVDELVIAMNRAAEAAVPQAEVLLLAAVRAMSVNDAVKIVQGGDTSVTVFFEEKTRLPLAEKFLPIVTTATERLSLAEKYNAVAGKASGLGLLKKEDTNIQVYVTRKALDALFLMIGEEEKKIRRDPIGSGSEILRRVFG
jgi:TRAP-type mannitol/chloroaromatic compound transport system substrate-binding protein